MSIFKDLANSLREAKAKHDALPPEERQRQDQALDQTLTVALKTFAPKLYANIEAVAKPQEKSKEEPSKTDPDIWL